MKISGTLINYFFHCKRQCYLFAKRVNLEDNSEDVRVGKVLHEIFEKNKLQSYATLVILDENKLLKTIKEIENLTESASLPKVEFDKKCKKCAYFEYCFI